MWEARTREGKIQWAGRCTWLDGPFTCPGCKSPVALKRGEYVAAHFAHIATEPCGYAGSESELHFEAKRLIVHGLSCCGVHAVKECGDIPGVRPDVMMVFGEDSEDPYRIAIEIQVSPLPIREIHDRTLRYTQLGIPVLWCVPGFVGRPQLDYPLEPWIAYLHRMYFGKLWFWTGCEGSGEMVTPVRLFQWRDGIRLRCWDVAMPYAVQDLTTVRRPALETSRGPIPEALLWDRPEWPRNFGRTRTFALGKSVVHFPP